MALRVGEGRAGEIGLDPVEVRRRNLTPSAALPYRTATGLEIDSGDYGYCDKCGVEIGLKRLEARPTATLCIDCKTLDELRERQTSR